jgi:hypothetical protein
VSDVGKAAVEPSGEDRGDVASSRLRGFRTCLTCLAQQ